MCGTSDGWGSKNAKKPIKFESNSINFEFLAQWVTYVEEKVPNHFFIRIPSVSLLKHIFYFDFWPKIVGSMATYNFLLLRPIKFCISSEVLMPMTIYTLFLT